MQKLRTRRARSWLLPGLLCLWGTAPARAEDAPATEERLAWAGSLDEVDVEVVAPPALAGCPTAEAIATQTNAYVGWAFARAGTPDASAARVRLVFAHGDEENQVDVRLFQPDDSAPSGASLRVHQVDDSCEELGKMAALTVSLLARTPPPAPAVAAAVVAADPAPTPPPTEPVPPEPAAPPDATTVEPAPVSAPQPTPDPSGFEVGASLLGGYGFVPGWSGGGSLFGAWRSGRFAVRLAASFQAGPGETIPAAGASYEGFGGTGDVSGCYALLPKSQVCVLGGLLWLVASGRDFDQDRQGLGTSPFVGLGLAQRFAAGSRLEWGLRLEGTVPLVPIELLLQDPGGATTGLWQTPPVGVRLGVELAFH